LSLSGSGAWLYTQSGVRFIQQDSGYFGTLIEGIHPWVGAAEFSRFFKRIKVRRP
jgi:hypothetical protein